MIVDLQYSTRTKDKINVNNPKNSRVKYDWGLQPSLCFCDGLRIPPAIALAVIPTGTTIASAASAASAAGLQ